MDKKRSLIFVSLSLVLLLSLSFVSAGFFSNIWAKITGRVIVTDATIGADGWTNWLNRDGSSGSGDYETKSGFTGVCDTPSAIECRVIGTTDSFSSADTAPQVVSISPTSGCSCVNSNNPEGCLDYEVRFKCSATSACSDECSSGQTKCNGDILQTCGNYDADSCLEWPSSTNGGGNDNYCDDCSCTCGNYGKANEAGYCNDGKDNDCDGRTDSADSDCEAGGGESSTCESGVYTYPQDKDVPSNNILHYTPWGSDYKYAEGYCSIVHNCAGYKDVTTAVDGSTVCRCDTGSFGCEGYSCTTSGRESGIYVTITSVMCVECDEDADCGNGSICRNYECVSSNPSAPTCSDGKQNGNETGVDCGGPCPACSTSQTCSDTDSGINVFVAGIVTDSSGNKYPDKCIDGTTINETTCENPKVRPQGEINYGLLRNDAFWSEINCPSGYFCSNGACIEFSPNNDCLDNDKNTTYPDGKNYYEKGTFGANSDFCLGNTLIEYYCSIGRRRFIGENYYTKNSIKYDCSSEGKVCQDGACKVVDLTPRIAYWPGKVNQHTENGVWKTDPSESTNLDKLTYCKKWYPNTFSVKEYKLETINNWCTAGNADCSYISTRQSYECVPLKENGETCSSDFECKSGSCGEILANERNANPESICHENSSKCIIDSSGIEVNEGGKSCLNSTVFRTCSVDSNQKISWGNKIFCPPDESCFEGRGCLKHEFIFRLFDGHFPADKYVENPQELKDAMELSNPYIGISFRINKMPPEESDLDDYVSEMEARGYYYYITAGSSDFVAFSGITPYPGLSPFLENISKICGYLKNEHAEGLYLHELVGITSALAGDNPEKVRELFDWDSVEQVLACAKANKKKVLWNDFAGGWNYVRYAINHDEKVKKIFEKYGDVLVPLLPDNTNTEETWRKDLPGGLDFKDIKYVSDKYCNGERGGSIQDWHWNVITGTDDGYLHVPASDIERYIKINYDEGGKYSQFEDSNWDKNEPNNHGEFYLGVQRGEGDISGFPTCVSDKCGSGFTCESPKCIGSYDEKAETFGIISSDYGIPSDWDVDTYYTYAKCNCMNAGLTAYAVHDLAWYKHTCAKNKFLGICFGAHWSKSKTYVANAYKFISCEGLSESDCNSHPECSWGSFSCIKNS